jgi:hypothetical protein
MLKFIRMKKDDELYSPNYIITPILKFIPKNKIIWLPFDTIKSNYVKVLKKQGYDIVYSHKQTGKDFFSWQPKLFDVIISNPPFSKKLDIFRRLWQLNKPFAILMCLPCLNYQEIGEFFYENKGLQLMIFDKKVSFNGNQSSFNTSYFCKDFLDKDLIFEHLPDNNVVKYFRKNEIKLKDKNLFEV